jgi:pyruvate formate lyase activating enzyme
MHSGAVFNIQKYCLQDGPGIRTTVFLKGCPLSCSWCHNPEGIAPEAEVTIIENRCLVCGECRRTCRFNKDLPGEGALQTGHELCILCGDCVTACPTGARQLIGRGMTVAEVMREIVRDRIFYEESRGGVTFSGGEPLMQVGFLRELLEACRSEGINTAVDTCGYACTGDLLGIALVTDLFLYDLKFMDDVKHRHYTGVSNATILSNLKALGSIHGNIWLRIPLIPGINDSEYDFEDLARLAASVHGVRQVNLLPYHKTGLQKFRRLGRTYTLDSVQEPSAELIERIRRKFCAVGLNAVFGG